MTHIATYNSNIGTDSENKDRVHHLTIGDQIKKITLSGSMQQSSHYINN